MRIGRWEVSKTWVAIYSVTGLALIAVGAVQPNAALIVFGALLIPFGIGLDAALRQRRSRKEREPVRRV